MYRLSVQDRDETVAYRKWTSRRRAGPVKAIAWWIGWGFALLVAVYLLLVVAIAAAQS